MKKIIQIIIGNVLMAFAISTLILDNSSVVGGVSGISTVFHFYTGISVSLCVGIFRKSICDENIGFNILLSYFIRIL